MIPNSALRPSRVLFLLVCGCGPQGKEEPGTSVDGPDDSGTSSDTGALIDGDGDGWSLVQDCDDGDPSIHPGAVEICNGIDDDCDRLIDDSDDSLSSVGLETFYEDADGDGYGTADVTRAACVLPAAHAAQAGDCDDLRPSVHPGADEVCGSGLDEDCDGGYSAECGLDGISAEGVIPTAEALELPLSDTTANPYSLRVATFDLDGDGVDDVITGDVGLGDDGGVHVLWGGTTDTPEATLLGGADGPAASLTDVGWRLLALPDVSGDGRSDLVVASSAGVWLVQSGDVARGEGTHLSTVGALAIDTDVVVPEDLTSPGDLDDDGVVELLVSQASGGVHLFMGTQLSSSEPLSLADAVRVPARECPGLGGEGMSTGLDLDGDGFSDMAVGCPNWYAGGRGRVVVFEGASLGDRLASGTLEVLPEDACISNESGGTNNMGRLVMPAGDLDHDGYPDLAVVQAATTVRVFGGRVDWFASTGCGAGTGQRVPTDADLSLDAGDEAAPYRSTSWVVPHEDLTGDGRDDLLLMNLNIGNWSGSATFFTGAEGWDAVPTTPTYTLQGERDDRLLHATVGDPWGLGLPTVFMPAVEDAPVLRSLSVPGY